MTRITWNEPEPVQITTTETLETRARDVRVGDQLVAEGCTRPVLATSRAKVVHLTLEGRRNRLRLPCTAVVTVLRKRATQDSAAESERHRQARRLVDGVNNWMPRLPAVMGHLNDEYEQKGTYRLSMFNFQTLYETAAEDQVWAAYTNSMTLLIMGRGQHPVDAFDQIAETLRKEVVDFVYGNSGAEVLLDMAVNTAKAKLVKTW